MCVPSISSDSSSRLGIIWAYFPATRHSEVITTITHVAHTSIVVVIVLLEKAIYLSIDHLGVGPDYRDRRYGVELSWLDHLQLASPRVVSD